MLYVSTVELSLADELQVPLVSSVSRQREFALTNTTTCQIFVSLLLISKMLFHPVLALVWVIRVLLKAAPLDLPLAITTFSSVVLHCHLL